MAVFVLAQFIEQLDKADIRSAVCRPGIVQAAAHLLICLLYTSTEYQQAMVNRGLHPGLETLLLPADPFIQHIN